MQRMWADRGVIARTTAVLCVLLVLAMGTAQAIHSHPDNAKTHSCSICSVPHANFNTQSISAAPVMVAVPVARVEAITPGIFRPATSNFVRPPPAA